MTASVFKTGNSALITGAGLGIGRATAIHLASLGMNVAMVDLPSDDLDQALAQAKEKASGKIIAINADVSEEENWPKILKSIEDEFSSIDFLMNNAVTRIGRGLDASLEEWRKAFEVNFWGVVMGVQTFLPMMQSQETRCVIVNVGSKQGITNPPGHPIYNVSKAALKTFTEQLEHSLRSEVNNKITSHLLVPGWTTTGKAEHKEGAWLPQQIVDEMMSRVDAGGFYIICPDGEVTSEMDSKRILWGAADITENRLPLSRWHEDFKDEAGKACS